MKHALCLSFAVLAMSVTWGRSRADQPREENPRFKGVELYSWRDDGGNWVFALLDGTNRLKTEQEVKAAKNQVQGAEELKKALARLAVGEQVFWTHQIPGFEFPPDALQRKIRRGAEEAKVDLRIVRREE